MIGDTRRRALTGAVWLACLMASTASGSSAAVAGEPPRILLVLLDSVPYGLVAEITDPAAGEAALFRDFPPPVPLISTFPSSTSVAVPGILGSFGVESSPGYEARFFDWDDRRVRGGGAISYFRIDFPWRHAFDWSGKGAWRSAVAALRPVEASIGRLERAFEAFVESDEPRFTVYIETTDTVAHLRSPRPLAEVFVALDEAIAEIRRRHPERPFRVVLLSDHGIAGGEPLVNTWKPVRRAARAAGFRLARKLRRPDDLALTPYGLVSSFEAYARPDRGERAAAALAAADGVDLCVTPAGGGWVVEGDGGRALVERRRDGERALWRYRPVTGDPLGYAEVAAELGRAAGERAGTGTARAAADGWYDDRRWLEATADHRYPDALYRLAHAFELVENPATVVCSTAPGHMYGPGRTEALARWTQGPLRWTHGALLREASWGFLLTDLPGAEADGPQRFDEGVARLLAPPADPGGGLAVTASGESQ